MNTPAQVAPALSLRPYQIDAIAETRRRMARVRSVLINAPTGAGKTILGCQIIKQAVEKQRRVLCALYIPALKDGVFRAKS